MACEREANRQLQGLQARLTQVEDDLANTYTALSAMALQMSLVPTTSAVGLPFKAIFTGVPGGLQALQKTLSELTIPGIQIPSVDDMKKLALEAAMVLVDSMAAQMIALTTSLVDQAVASVEAAAASVIAAEQALEAAILAGVEAPILAAQAALDVANGTLDAANTLLENTSSLLTSQSNISNCITADFIITP